MSGLSCPPAVEERLQAFVTSRLGWVVGDPWYESDHAIFAMRGVPSVGDLAESLPDLVETSAVVRGRG